MQFNGQTPWGTMTIAVSGEMTARELMQKVTRVEQGEIIRDVNELSFRDPSNFRAGELHAHYSFWEKVVERCPKMAAQTDVLDWIKNKVSIFPYFQHFRGSFKGEQYDSDRPPHRLFRNNMSCKPFVRFVQETLINRLGTGAISLVGGVGKVTLPHIVLSLTGEPSKPRLCHDTRYLNLWMKDNPFSLDTLNDLPRYVTKDSFQTVLDDKSGYDHILLTESSRPFFGIQWGGWFFTYNTLPFGWKVSPFI